MARGKTVKLQLDKKINFAQVGQKPSKTPTYVVAALGVAVLTLAFFKFAVIDRLAQVNREQERTADMKEELAGLTAKVAELESLPDQYFHYTLSDMTSEELSRVSRSDVSDLVLLISEKVVSMDSFRVTGNALSISVTSKTLGDITRLVGELKENPLVESVSLSSAETSEGNVPGLAEGDGEVVDIKARLNIFLRQAEGS